MWLHTLPICSEVKMYTTKMYGMNAIHGEIFIYNFLLFDYFYLVLLISISQKCGCFDYLSVCVCMSIVEFIWNCLFVCVCVCVWIFVFVWFWPWACVSEHIGTQYITALITVYSLAIHSVCRQTPVRSTHTVIHSGCFLLSSNPLWSSTQFVVKPTYEIQPDWNVLLFVQIRIWTRTQLLLKMIKHAYGSETYAHRMYVALVNYNCRWNQIFQRILYATTDIQMHTQTIWTECVWKSEIQNYSMVWNLDLRNKKYDYYYYFYTAHAWI